jgi:predicted ATP-grasp superfamily ATP-dependent carboligase
VLAASHYCKGYFGICFDIDNYESAADKLNAIVFKIGADWVIPSDAVTTRFLGAVRHLISTKAFPVPSPSVFDILNDKSRFMRLCSQLAVPHPKSELVAQKAELTAALDRAEIGTPVVVKPLNRASGIGVFKFERNELQRIETLIDYEPILLQEFIEGEDISLSLFCRGGSPFATVTYHRTDQFCDFFQNDLILKYGLAITRYTNFEGVINFDARVSPDGSVTLLECNPRFFFPVHQTMIAGINFVRLGLEHFASHSRNGCLTLNKRVPLTKMKDVLTGIKTNDLSTLFYKLRDPFPLIMLRYFSDVSESS